MPTSTEIESTLRAGREGAGIEFKRSMSWADESTQAKVVLASLALANKRDGGLLAFGLEVVSGQPVHSIVGMDESHFASFSQDAVVALVNAHATPHIDLSVEHLIVDGKRIVAIVVREFKDFPVICAKDLTVAGKRLASKGKIYCRSRRMAETTEIQSPDDMRDLIELATAKGLERYFRLRDIERRASRPDAALQFDRQLKDILR